MSRETVLISVVAATAGAARAAVEQLRAAGVELGRKGEWLAYGPLLVEVEHTAPPPPPAPPPLEKDGIYPFIH